MNAGNILYAIICKCTMLLRYDSDVYGNSRSSNYNEVRLIYLNQVRNPFFAK